MQDVPKRAMNVMVKNEIVDALQKLADEAEVRQIYSVPMAQQDEYREMLRKQCERVSAFLGL